VVLAAAVAFLVLVLCVSLVWAVSASIKKCHAEENARGWRVRGAAYEELFEGQWRTVRFEVLNFGHEVRIIDIGTAELWASFPPWAAHRRDEIVGRIRLARPNLRFEVGRERYVKHCQALAAAGSNATNRKVI